LIANTQRKSNEQQESEKDACNGVGYYADGWHGFCAPTRNNPVGLMKAKQNQIEDGKGESDEDRD
jgi:hypothetical protein